MNYIWEVMLQADRQGIAREDISFTNAVSPSPYLEVAFEDVNTASLDGGRVEVNPLYRFERELGRLFDLNIEGLEQTRELFFDLFLHYMAQVDLREGLSRQDFFIRFIHEDILSGGLGEELQRDYELFASAEQKSLCLHLLCLLKTGSCLSCFRGAVKALYPYSIVYESRDMAHELLVYLGKGETEEEIRRIRVLVKLFLPVQNQVHIFYDHHFGIIGVDETMVIGEMVLF